MWAARLLEATGFSALVFLGCRDSDPFLAAIGGFGLGVCVFHVCLSYWSRR